MKTEALTPDGIQRIHEATLRILERVGVQVPHQEMLARFEGAGATVDHQAQVVRIPPELLDRCLKSCGKSYTLYGRDETKVARFGQGERNYNSIAGEASWLEEIGGQRRFASLKDVDTAARFADALDAINVVGAMSDPHELSVSYRCVEVMAHMLRNTTKPITFWFHDRASAKYINEMLVALRGDERQAAEKPLCYPFLEPISPLRFPFHGIDLLFETSRFNLPVPIGPMAQMGLTAPMGVAGVLAQENAEILAGVCITQLVREGMPVCYGGICHAFDMRTTQMIFSGPEQAIYSAAMTQMGKHYGLPVYVNAGLTDSKRPDAQAGMESAVTLSMAASAGADIFGHMGICGVDQATSLDMLVLQNEVISYVESVNRPLDLSDEAFGLDVLEEVGIGGTFIDTLHTAERFRRELWVPRILDREYYQAWLDNGGSSCEERCRARKQEILATHQPEPISPQLDQTLNEIVAAARTELSGK